MNQNTYKNGSNIVVKTIGDPLNQGGFGSIYECVISQDGDILEGDYVLKQLNFDRVDDSTKNRFIREMNYMIKLNHQNILQPVIVDEKNLVIVMKKMSRNFMEYIQSMDFNYNEAIDIFNKVLDACIYYSSESILHRDLKAENILLDDNNIPFLTDFGISGRIDRGETESITMVGTGMGTLFYMAPEQINSLIDADIRSDVFSLGRILFVIAARESQGYFDYRYAPNIDERKFKLALKSIIKKSTSQNPTDRYQTINEFKRYYQLYLYPEDTLFLGYEKIIDKLDSNNSEDLNIEHSFNNLLESDFDEKIEMFVKMTTSQHYKLYQINLELYEKYLEQISEEISSQSYPWSYVDSIVYKVTDVLEILNGVLDLDVIVKVILSSVDVAVSHHRFNAMQSIGYYINSIKSNTVIAHLKSNLTDYDKSNLSTIKEYDDGRNIKLLIE